MASDCLKRMRSGHVTSAETTAVLFALCSLLPALSDLSLSSLVTVHSSASSQHTSQADFLELLVYTQALLPPQDFSVLWALGTLASADFSHSFGLSSSVTTPIVPRSAVSLHLSVSL